MHLANAIIGRERGRRGGGGARRGSEHRSERRPMRPRLHPDGELAEGTIEVTLLAEMRGLQRQIAALHDELHRGQGPRTDVRPDPWPPEPRVAAAGLYATCLGQFRAFRDGHELTLGGGRLVVDLFRLLVGAGRPIPRDEVLELLWPNADP